MIIFVKILSILLGVMVISKTYLDYKKKSESLIMFLFWTIGWIGIIIVAMFPEIIEKVLEISKAQQISTGTFLGMALIFLFFVIYRVYIKADRLEKQLRDMVSKLGVRDIEKK